ncbi:MAG TPA: hypothetical protein EYP54_11495 [Anaerolineales bacterium]|nr:hypothetical protein [Anaerolineales bacterium]
MERVGDFLQEAKSRALQGLVMLLGGLVYAGMLLWTGVHNYNLLTQGVPDGMLLWAVIGVIALELNAVALPLALHNWTFAAAHRLAALLFYALDLALLFLNVALDYGLVVGTGIAYNWLTLYRQFMVPATPIYAGLVWGVLWMLDPEARRKTTVEELRASTQEVLARRLAEAAKSADVEQMVQDAARRLVQDVVGQSLGRYLALPAEHRPGKAMPFPVAGDANAKEEGRVWPVPQGEMVEVANNDNNHHPQFTTNGQDYTGLDVEGDA